MATEQTMKTEDFNAVAIALDKLRSMGEAIICISQAEFPERDLMNLGYIISDLAGGAYRVMCPKADD